MQRVEFTREMRDTYTVLVPDMLPVHFALLKNVFRLHGYRMEVLKNEGADVANAGLKYVHNDTCYPALLCIGQFIDALESGRYDVHKTALLLTQTGGGCRASNYIHLLRKALEKAGLGFVPVISLNPSGLEKNSGFQFTPSLLIEALYSIFYGDVLMLLKNQAEPYEVQPGATKAVLDRWVEILTEQFGRHAWLPVVRFRRNLRGIARDFEAIERTKEEKIKVGIVGEIYVKYSSMGNNHLEQFLLGQGCEVDVPGLMGFLSYCVEVRIDDINLYGGSRFARWVLRRAMDVVTHFERVIAKAIRKNSGYRPAEPFRVAKSHLNGLIGLGCKMGEGWLLPAEMIELIESGVTNIVCVQPFGCLPNHIVGKGPIHALRERYPLANIVPIDYDPSATRVNQENRLKLMLAVARENAASEKGA
ncbi:MAG TPA: 2-hydroxyacyl-CoA dehydratase [Candidatus Faecivicinus avistercoris]|nr:2-hydroxyacyl-CoA dehydratase [Candidatus Faecivicinus avistercoris]